jgi:ribosome-associated toxin RatA of RatAB toxin-antitoxin module
MLTNILLCVVLVLLACTVHVCVAGSRDKPHGHNGTLPAYNGKLLPFKLSKDQLKTLDAGGCVSWNEKAEGKGGKGVVVQDIQASPAICMAKIRDLVNYPKMVPNCKSVSIYESTKFMNGTSRTGAEFKVGVLGLKFNYFLVLTHEPKHSTLTWTLDYKKNSDFDDNVGHWQVMKHPVKAGWTRVLYSTRVKLFPWIPGMVVKFLTTKALVESTTWVKKESEKEAAKQKVPEFKLPSWMSAGKGGFLKGGQTADEGASHRVPAFAAFVRPAFMRFKGFGL